MRLSTTVAEAQHRLVSACQELQIAAKALDFAQCVFETADVDYKLACEDLILLLQGQSAVQGLAA